MEHNLISGLIVALFTRAWIEITLGVSFIFVTSCGQSVVQIDGRRYHVETTGAADSDLHIKLILARGG